MSMDLTSIHSNSKEEESKCSIVNLEDRDLFTTRATTVIQPLLRYAQYELQQQAKKFTSPHDMANNMMTMVSLQQELNQDPKISQNSFLLLCFHVLQSSMLASTNDTVHDEGLDVNSIFFRGLKIKVENKSLRMLLWKLNDCKKDLVTLEHGTIDEDTLYVDLLTYYDDAITLISEDLKGLVHMASGPSVNTKKAEAYGLLGYIKYERLKLLMMRTEYMIHELEKKQSHGNVDAEVESKLLEETAHLYDTLLQDAKAVVDIPGGVTNDAVTVLLSVEDDEFILQAKANVLRIRALRCYYVGRLYGTNKLGKYGEALTLFDRASKLAAQAAEEIAACSDMDNADKYIQHLLDLELHLTKAKCQAKVDAFLFSATGGGKSSSVPHQSFFRHLDDFESYASFLKNDQGTLPPLEPIICKPSFFDIAGTYACEYPMDVLQMHIQSTKPPSSRGILGWFRS